MLNKENIKEILEKLNLSSVDLEIYTTTFENMWKVFEPVYAGVDDSHNGKHIYHVFRRCMEMIKWSKDNTRNFNEDKESRYILKLGLAAMVHDAFSLNYRRNHHEKAFEFVRKMVDIKVIEGNLLDPLTKAENVYIATEDALKFLYFQKINLSHVVDYSTYDVLENDFIVDKREYHKDNIKHINILLKSFSKYDLLEVSKMVLEHRASYEGTFSTELCEIFSAADRDDLVLSVVINRIYTCALNDENKFECDHNGFQPLVIKTKGRDIKILPIINQLEKDGWDNKLIKTFYHLCEKFSKDGYAYKNLKIDGFYKIYYKDQLENFWREIDEIIFIPMLMFKYIKRDIVLPFKREDFIKDNYEVSDKPLFRKKYPTVG